MDATNGNACNDGLRSKLDRIEVAISQLREQLKQGHEVATEITGLVIDPTPVATCSDAQSERPQQCALTRLAEALEEQVMSAEGLRINLARLL